MASIEDILKDVKAHVNEFYEEHFPSEKFSYHNFNHIDETVGAVKTIAKAESIAENKIQLMEIAAWFHDMGYAKDLNNHEEESVKLAKSFLSKYDLNEADIAFIEKMIMATVYGTDPDGIEEMIMKDADLSHLCQPDLKERAENLLDEMNTVCGMNMSQEEWNKKSLTFMSSHTYYTQYAKAQFEEGKNENLSGLKSIIEDRIANSSIEKSKKKKKKKKDKEKEKKKDKEQKSDAKSGIVKAGKGRETLFRTVGRNHIQLSTIADNKANFMLSINAIILSIIVSVMFPQFEEEPKLIIPSMVLLVVCVLTIIYATISTRPKVTEGKFNKEDIINKKGNLLFFGNFHSMNLDDFEWGMNEIINDEDYLYSSMSKDLYFLGKVLHKKYKYLRVCYDIFMYGMIISILTFLVFLAFI